MFDSDKAKAAWVVGPVWTAGTDFTCCRAGNFVLCLMATLSSSSVRLMDFPLEETGIEIPGGSSAGFRFYGALIVCPLSSSDQPCHCPTCTGMGKATWTMMMTSVRTLRSQIGISRMNSIPTGSVTGRPRRRPPMGCGLSVTRTRRGPALEENGTVCGAACPGSRGWVGTPDVPCCIESCSYSILLCC